MSFFQGLIESFVPTVAFADNEETAAAPVEAPVEAVVEVPVVEEAPAPVVEEVVAVEETPAPAAEEETPAPVPAEEEPEQEETPAPTSEEETPAESEEAEEEEEDEEEEDEEDEDEDEEEEGSADPLDKLRAECATKAEIKPYVHHYAECVERVTKAQQEEGYEDREYKEDCVEEFFHLQHHINDCVAPRLFYKLR